MRWGPVRPDRLFFNCLSIQHRATARLQLTTHHSLNLIPACLPTCLRCHRDVGSHDPRRASSSSPLPTLSCSAPFIATHALLLYIFTYIFLKNIFFCVIAPENSKPAFVYCNHVFSSKQIFSSSFAIYYSSLRYR